MDSKKLIWTGGSNWCTYCLNSLAVKPYLIEYSDFSEVAHICGDCNRDRILRLNHKPPKLQSPAAVEISEEFVAILKVMYE